jgi:hypothetical protein
MLPSTISGLHDPVPEYLPNFVTVCNCRCKEVSYGQPRRLSSVRHALLISASCRFDSEVAWVCLLHRPVQDTGLASCAVCISKASCTSCTSFLWHLHGGLLGLLVAAVIILGLPARAGHPWRSRYKAWHAGCTYYAAGAYVRVWQCSSANRSGTQSSNTHGCSEDGSCDAAAQACIVTMQCWVSSAS